MDRFEILYFTEKIKGVGQSLKTGQEILEKLEQVRQWQRQTGRTLVSTARRPVKELESEVESFYFQQLMNKEMGSFRRYQATLRVARSLADLQQSEIIQGDHVEQALKLTYLPFERLRRWD